MNLVEVVSQAVFNPLPVVAVVLACGWYLWAARRRPGWPAARTASLLVAGVTVLVATTSGVDVHDRDFAVHAIQEVLLTLVAPLALAASAPLVLAGIRLPGLLRHPVVGWAVYGTAVCTLYFTGLYSETVRHPILRAAVLAWLFVAGCAWWAPLVGTRLGYWWKMGYLLLALPFHTIVGMALESQTTTIAPFTPLATMHLGAVIVWVSAQVVGLLGAITVFIAWLRSEEQRAKAEDEASDAAAAQVLTHWRATRDAAARAAGPPA
jgi:putative copper resistance protein D